MHPNAEKLSEREQEILQLVATGASNKEIALRLSISTNTVKVHLRNIFEKLEVKSRTEAAIFAVNAGIVSSYTQIDGINTEKILAKRSIQSKFLVALIGIGLVALGIGAMLLWWFKPKPPPVSDSQTDAAWKHHTPMPTARYGFAAVVHENKIYALGGETGDGVSNLVEVYEPETNRWITFPNKPVAVSDVHAAVIDGKIYVPGGRLDTGEATDILEIYDPNRDRWLQGKSLPEKVSAYALVALEGKIYLFGGRNGKETLSSVLVYEPGKDAWSHRTPLSSPRAYSGAIVVGGKIYLMGGYDGRKALNLNEKYAPNLDDGTHNPWSAQEPMPDKRYGMGVTSMLDVIYLVGGIGDRELAPPAQGYMTLTDEWQTLTQPISNAWSNLGLVALGTEIFTVGGKTGELPKADLLSLKVVYIQVLPFIP